MKTIPPAQPTPQRATEAAEICKLSKDARALLREEMTPGDFFEALRERGLYTDAIRFLAHALPKRVAVWWGCLCVWAVNRQTPQEKFEVSLQAAVRWVLTATKENRQAAEAPGRGAGFGDPAGCLAMAACWSGGSMAPAEMPVVPPPPHMTGKLVGEAVLLAAVKYDARRQRENHRLFAALGAEVFQGRNLWRAGNERDEEPADILPNPPTGTSTIPLPAHSHRGHACQTMQSRSA
jgi:hypothetical protein